MSANTNVMGHDAPLLASVTAIACTPWRDSRYALCMRLCFPVVAFAFVSVGCFSDPPSVPTGGTSTTEGDASTSSNESSTGGGTTSGSEASTSASSDESGGDTTGERPDQVLYLYPLTCEDATWTASGMIRLSCADSMPGPGPFLRTYDNFTRDGEELERVVEVHPPNLIDAPVDGVYSIDTTGFTEPALEVGVACVLDAGCLINYSITSENTEGEPLSGVGGSATASAGIDETTLPLPPNAMVNIRFNISSSSDAGGIADSADRILLIDPRIVEAGQ